MVGQQNVDIADTLHLRDVATANVFLAFCIFGTYWRHRRIRLNRPSAAAMRPYVKLLWPLVFYLQDSCNSTGYQHGPLTQAVFTGVQNDTRVYGPCSRLANTGSVH